MIIEQTDRAIKTPTEADAANFEWYANAIFEQADRLKFGVKPTRQDFLIIARAALRCADAVEARS